MLFQTVTEHIGNNKRAIFKMKYNVFIKSKDGKFSKQIATNVSERTAERTLMGALINLNTEDYYVDEQEVKE